MVLLQVMKKKFQTSTHDMVRRIRLQLVDGLQLIKLCPCAGEAQGGGLGHQAELCVNVGFFVGIAEGVPVCSASS